ncbi:DUF1922 domain-containing protein [Micromonospora sp. NPDC000207]|uniref:DUF1922 domain-containing protein n=1 Tax=Micromonospora sp. NPDC000207 TaxID=3154246 RepID=UPI00331EF1B1
MPSCTVCDKPVDDPAAYACTSCTTNARRHLDDIADTTPAARDVAGGATRRGTPTRSNGDARLPINLGASARLDAAQTALTTWARHVAGERGIQPPTGPDPLHAAAQWLTRHLDWLRHRQEVPEAYRDIAAVRRIVTGIVDRPAGRVLVGACDCGTVLYAKATAATIGCRTCERAWDVAESRDILRQALDDKHMTASQIAALAVVADPDLDRQRVRRLVNVWGHRHAVDVRGHSADGDPLYRLGDVMDRVLASRPVQPG